MSRDELVEVGSVRKTHGVRGELKLVVDEPYEELLAEAEFLFIGSTAANALPFEVEEIRGSDYIVKLTELTSREQAAELRGSSVFVRVDPTAMSSPDAVDRRSPSNVSLRGFAIIDVNRGEIGEIKEIIEAEQQSLARIEHENREKLIPLASAYIKGVDFLKKIVFMDLPEGLLDL